MSGRDVADPPVAAVAGSVGFPAGTYRAHLEALAEARPDAPAIGAPGRDAMRFGRLLAHASVVRARFDDWGIGPGDVVAWPAIERLPTAAASAIVPACATLLPLPAGLAVDAYERAFTRTRAKALVMPPRPGHPAEEAAKRCGMARIALEPRVDDVVGAFDLAMVGEGTTLSQGATLPRDVLFVMLTSGTTGRPKLVPTTWRMLSTAMHAMGQRLGIGPGDASGHVTTLHLANGLRNAALLALLHGGAVHVLPEGDADALVGAIAAGEVTYAWLSFAICREILRRLEDGLACARGRLRFLRASSGRLEPDEMDRLEARLGVPVVTGLSTTETGTIAQQELSRERRQPGSVGRPLAAELRIVDERGAVAPRGTIGEVQVRGAQVLGGYLDDPGLDARAFDGDWFRTGDLGQLDERGELHLAGRLSETINRGGEKIAPQEIDAVLRSVAGVEDAAAFGVPHPVLGEEVVAAVVRATGSGVDAIALAARVRAALGDRRTPRRIWFVDDLPRSATGKVARAALPAHVGFRAAEREAISATGAASPLEIALAALWSAALHRSSTGLDEDFFLVGGDSLRGAALLAQVRAVFGVAIPVQALFDEASTVAGMARRIVSGRQPA